MEYRTKIASIKDGFKPIKGFEKFYAINKAGVVISFLSKPTITLKAAKIPGGYLTVNLLRNDRSGRVSMYVHRLAATTFIKNKNKKPCVNHLDGNKLNNKISNLQWCTYSENMVHANRTGLNPVTRAQIENLGRRNSKKVIDLTTGETFDSLKIAAEARGIKYRNLINQFRPDRRNQTNLRYF